LPLRLPVGMNPSHSPDDSEEPLCCQTSSHFIQQIPTANGKGQIDNRNGPSFIRRRRVAEHWEHRDVASGQLAGA
jgi:hypothetical protein